MTDLLVLDLVDKGLVTNQIVITVGYDVENLTDPERRKRYHGKIVKDGYGRQIPMHAHGTANLDGHTSSAKKILAATSELFDRIVDPSLLIRRLNVTACNVLTEADAPKKDNGMEQLDLFTDYAQKEAEDAAEEASLDRERKLQQVTLAIKKKFGTKGHEPARGRHRQRTKFPNWRTQGMNGNYDDMIHLPHHVSKIRPRMPMSDRAAQFSPFAALVGYDAAIAETGRLTGSRVILDEYEIQRLNEQLCVICERLEEQPIVKITYFRPDDHKDGGEYVTVSGTVKRIDSIEQVVTMTDGTKILIADIIEIEN